ncbi:MAG: Fic family protein [Chitinophaga sp.]
MATPSERLADSLNELKRLQDDGKLAIKSDELTRTHRERLVANGFLKEVVRGWYIISRPDSRPGDTTFWYSNFWEFCSAFLTEKYNDNWCISAEQSVQLHAGNWTVPQQLIIRAPNANNFKTALLYDTSIFSIKSELPIKRETTAINGIRLLTIPASLIHCSPGTYTQSVTDIRTALSLIPESSELLALLLEGGHSTIAGRLAGAFRNNGQTKIADDIIKTMTAAGYDIREVDPFTSKLQIQLSQRERSPYVNKIKLMWAEMRPLVLEIFPKAPGLPKDKARYLKQVEDIYKTDAYHSLSIEKYKVTPELIEKVRSGAWNHRENDVDKNERDAMAARGYWQAFQKVKESIGKILDGANPGTIADNEHGDWYRELFAPSITAGLLKPADLAGYRNHQVYLLGSKHVPLHKDGVRDAMPALFEQLVQEPDASVRAVLGHFIFVYIHPYMDGNGRMGRFLMNIMLASGGYPWTVIPVEERDNYMKALESASADQDIKTFTTFLAYLVNQALKGKPVARLKD